MRIVGEFDSRGKPRVQTLNDDEPMTVQSDAHLANINFIMSQFKEGGMESLNEADLMFADVSEFTDLRDALDQARQAELVFMRLPSKVREIFDHDVAVWLDTAHDKEKRDALVAAGFLKAEAVEPQETPPAPPVGPSGTPTAPQGTEEGIIATPAE